MAVEDKIDFHSMDVDKLGWWLTYFMLLMDASSYNRITMFIFWPITLLTMVVFYPLWRFEIYPSKDHPMSYTNAPAELDIPIINFNNKRKKNKIDINYI